MTEYSEHTAITVAICDDHGIIRSGIQRILESTPAFRLVGSAASGADLLAMLDRISPDLLVLDIRLSDANGLDLLEQVVARSPRTRVVMLSMYDAKGYVAKARARGARAYLTKECLDDELLSLLHDVARDEDPASFRSAVPETGRTDRAGQPDIDTLSSRELEVMKLIASGLTNGEIAAELTVSPRTVESHRASIQRKLQVRTRAELARVARDAGLLD
ncbi:response regulator transcription factor [Raineyella sp. W15-4]|uniref:response regulator transcription factor n=1 Tax=Raineyella sp. W15-4 TaxID=3081651 RepID=UPI002954D0FC|nr:response regulator transcription factor [Raineyella sp. W15-4]WOQ16262.1 response regulator transcription factor [Raineyella sp. W15-4]